jgi:hypothetical protein
LTVPLDPPAAAEAICTWRAAERCSFASAGARHGAPRSPLFRLRYQSNQSITATILPLRNVFGDQFLRSAARALVAAIALMSAFGFWLAC